MFAFGWWLELRFTLNQIVLHAEVFQPPYLDRKQHITRNFGTIGCVRLYR